MSVMTTSSWEDLFPQPSQEGASDEHEHHSRQGKLHFCCNYHIKTYPPHFFSLPRLLFTNHMVLRHCVLHSQLYGLTHNPHPPPFQRISTNSPPPPPPPPPPHPIPTFVEYVSTRKQTTDLRVFGLLFFFVNSVCISVDIPRMNSTMFFQSFFLSLLLHLQC